jgi:hypothetical protein
MSPVPIDQKAEERAQTSHAILNARKLIPKPRGPLKPVGLPWPLQIADKEEEFIEALYELRNAEDNLTRSENLHGKMDHPKRAVVAGIKKEIAEIQMKILGIRSASTS